MSDKPLKSGVYQRAVDLRTPDERWVFDWRLVSEGDIIATSGGQGYENKEQAEEMYRKVVRGDYNGQLYEPDADKADKDDTPQTD